MNIFSLGEWDFWDCGRDCGTCQLGLGSSAVCSRRHLSHQQPSLHFQKRQKYIDVKCSSSSSISRAALSLDQDCLHHQSPSSPYSEVSYWRFHASQGSEVSNFCVHILHLMNQSLSFCLLTMAKSWHPRKCNIFSKVGTFQKHQRKRIAAQMTKVSWRLFLRYYFHLFNNYWAYGHMDMVLKIFLWIMFFEIKKICGVQKYWGCNCEKHLDGHCTVATVRNTRVVTLTNTGSGRLHKLSRVKIWSSSPSCALSHYHQHFHSSPYHHFISLTTTWNLEIFELFWEMSSFHFTPALNWIAGRCCGSGTRT